MNDLHVRVRRSLGNHCYATADHSSTSVPGCTMMITHILHVHRYHVHTCTCCIHLIAQYTGCTVYLGIQKESYVKCPLGLFFKFHFVSCIRESVDSLCRDGVDTPRPPYIHVGNACTRPNATFVSLFSRLTVVLKCFCT